MWRLKFRDKEKSLAKDFHASILTVHNEKVRTHCRTQNLFPVFQYALLEGQFIAERLPGYLDCSLVSTEFPVAKDLYAFGMRKNSPYRSLFNHHFIRMIETGEMDRIKSKYIQVLGSYIQ